MLYDTFCTFIEDNKLTLHNHEFTRYSPNQDPSIIDHIVSNMDTKVGSVATTKNIFSDHCHLHTHISIDVPNTRPRFRYHRNLKLITREMLLEVLNATPHIYGAFNYTDPENIANVMVYELNRIIETLAPLKRFQVKRFFTLYRP